jgi:hypothetical protein
MAYAGVALPSQFTDPVSDDIPLFVGYNVCDVYAEAQWHESDVTIAGVAYSDHTQTGVFDIVATNAFDGRPSVTWPETNTTNHDYFYVRFSDSVTFDTIYLSLGPDGAGASSVIAEVADSFSDDTNVLQIASWTSLGAGERVFDIHLTNGAGGDPDYQFANVDQFRLRFTTSRVHINTLYLGQRRQLSREFLLPYDEQPLGSELEFTQIDGGGGSTYSRTTGFEDLRGKYLATTSAGASLYGLNDETTIQGLYEDCDYGTKPVVFCHHPDTDLGTYPDKAAIGFLNPKLQFKTVGPNLREWGFEFKECPPFWENV